MPLISILAGVHFGQIPFTYTGNMPESMKRRYRTRREYFLFVHINNAIQRDPSSSFLLSLSLLSSPLLSRAFKVQSRVLVRSYSFYSASHNDSSFVVDRLTGLLLLLFSSLSLSLFSSPLLCYLMGSVCIHTKPGKFFAIVEANFVPRRVNEKRALHHQGRPKSTDFAFHSLKNFKD